MFFVGIDIAKNSHAAAVIDGSGNIVVKPFKFANSVSGFEKFFAAVKGVLEDLSRFEFSMEATGHYWLNLYTKLMDFNVVVHVININWADLAEWHVPKRISHWVGRRGA